MVDGKKAFKVPNVAVGLILAILIPLVPLVMFGQVLDWKDPCPGLQIVAAIYWSVCVFKMHKILNTLTHGSYPFGPWKVLLMMAVPAVIGIVSMFGLVFFEKQMPLMVVSGLFLGISVLGLLAVQLAWATKMSRFLNERLDNSKQFLSWLPGFALVFLPMTIPTNAFAALLIEYGVLLFLNRKLDAVLHPADVCLDASADHDDLVEAFVLKRTLISAGGFGLARVVARVLLAIGGLLLIVKGDWPLLLLGIGYMAVGEIGGSVLRFIQLLCSGCIAGLRNNQLFIWSALMFVILFVDHAVTAYCCWYVISPAKLIHQFPEIAWRIGMILTVLSDLVGRDSPAATVGLRTEYVIPVGVMATTIALILSFVAPKSWIVVDIMLPTMFLATLLRLNSSYFALQQCSRPIEQTAELVPEMV